MHRQGQIFQRTSGRPERTFWLGLFCAALLHAGLIAQITRSSTRHFGERDGAPDALSVELVDAAELKSRSNVPAQKASAAADPGAAAPSPVAPPATAAPPPEERKPAEKLIDKKAWELAAPPDQLRKHSDTTSRTKDKANAEHKPQLSLNLDLPADFMGPAGRYATATRPPDITRSGENDEFGRGVVRALRQTMPAPRGETGRVTVRLLLSDSGNLAELQLIRAANDPTLTQSVLFAVKQSSFPIPPVGSTLNDRTFLVIYIYN